MIVTIIPKFCSYSTLFLKEKVFLFFLPFCVKTKTKQSLKNYRLRPEELISELASMLKNVKSILSERNKVICLNPTVFIDNGVMHGSDDGWQYRCIRTWFW